MFEPQQAPLLVLMDCQKEHEAYLAETGDPTLEPLIDRIERLLVNARYAGWTVAHCQLKRRDGAFASASRLSAPIDRLRPAGREPVFLRPDYSAYTDRAFARLMSERRDGMIYLAGFSLSFSLLATAFDAAERQDRLTLVGDAAGAGACPEPAAPPALRDVSLDVIGRLIPVVQGEDVLEDWPIPDIPEILTGTGLPS